MNKRASFLFKEIDIAPLIFFRVCFGLILLWEMFRYLNNGWVDFYWIHPNFHFTYDGFHWLNPLPGIGMKILFLSLGLISIFIAIGYRYKISIILFFLGFTYVFLLDKSYYLNQFYLICLISFWLIFIDAHKNNSVDAQQQRIIRSNTAPAWMLYILQFTITLPYFFGGIAKLNTDWIAGEPMRTWLAMKTDFPMIGSFFMEEWIVMSFSWGGLLFDLLIVPALLWKRTRLFAFIIAIGFHIMNASLFNIGIFPLLMIPASMLFFPPLWFRQLFNFIGVKSNKYGRSNNKKEKSTSQSEKLVGAMIFLFVVIQLVIPLRHYLYDGNVHWTEEGNRFSWHMKIKDKQAIIFYDVNNTKTEELLTINPNDYLTIKQYQVMKTQPDMILQFAHYLSNLFKEKGYRDIIISVQSESSLNHHPSQVFIPRTINLTKIKNAYNLVVPLQNIDK